MQLNPAIKQNKNIKWSGTALNQSGRCGDGENGKDDVTPGVQACPPQPLVTPLQVIYEGRSKSS